MAGNVKSAAAHGLRGAGQTPRPMPRKTAEDKLVEARIRAHVRQAMRDRGFKLADVARRADIDDGNLSRIMNEGRGIGLGVLLRLCEALKITPTRMLEEDPPEKFWDEGQYPRAQ